MTGDPIRYDSSLERVAPDEAETREALVATMRSIAETTYRDYGYAVRSVHAKSHALLEGELTVLDGLPAELAQGIFARPATYPVVLRLSTNPGDVLSDAVSAPRGLAIKVIGVEGKRLPGAEGAVTQDLVLANAPAFSAPNAQAFLKNLKLLAATTDRAEGAKVALSTVLRGAGAALRAVGVQSPTVASLGGQPLTHPLGESFYSQAPLRYGDYVAKVMVAPVSSSLTALTGRPLKLRGDPNALRASTIDALAQQDGEWEVRVQLCTDLERMPVEDASVTWPEDESPYRPVARIRVPAQPAWSEQRAVQADDGLAFSPWHGITAHQPLGSVNRVRRSTYAAISSFRAEHNRHPIQEPQSAVGLSGAPASTMGTTPGREGFRNATRTAPQLGVSGELGLGQRAASGAVGGLAGGLLVSAILLIKQALTRRPSDLAQLQRKLMPAYAPSWLADGPDPWEESAAHGGHLGLSVASGALYGALKPAAADPVTSGLVFGAGFLALAYAGAGPALRLTPPPWRDTRANNLQHAVVHALFGITTAVVADRVTRRLARSERRGRVG
jgi:hypothetical protein